LSHQLPMLPPLEQFWDELPALFDWLYETSSIIIEAPAPPPLEDVDPSWAPPSMIYPWRMRAPLELARYAGANHLCIKLTYDDKQRIIEPYEIKLTRAGNLILNGIRCDNGEWRSYRTDRIQEILVTQISFKPRYQISLTPLRARYSPVKKPF